LLTSFSCRSSRQQQLLALLQLGGKIVNEAVRRRRSVRLTRGRIVGWAAIATLIILPAVVMRFTSEVDWTITDFAFASVMLGGVGLAFEIAVRANGSWAYRGGAAIALVAALLLLSANAAVGVIGGESEPINLWFDLIPLLALFGAIGARFRSEGMAVTMLATAAAQIVIAIIAQLDGHFTWVFTSMWAGAWLLSGWLFHTAARDG
jgi:hypothetical protein